MLRTQRSRRFLKPEKSAIFRILAKGDRIKNVWKADILEMAESNLCYVECGANQDGAMESDCDHYLLSYEHFHLQNLPSKMSLKNLCLPQHLECRCGLTATVTSLQDTWNKGADQTLQGKRLSSKNYAAYAT